MGYISSVPRFKALGILGPICRRNLLRVILHQLAESRHSSFLSQIKGPVLFEIYM